MLPVLDYAYITVVKCNKENCPGLSPNADETRDDTIDLLLAPYISFQCFLHVFPPCVSSMCFLHVFPTLRCSR
jgi:hypothetical protein